MKKAVTQPLEWVRWPNIRIAPHPQLDWLGVIYDAAGIKQMAAAVLEADWNLWTRTTATLLETIASEPRIIDEINFDGFRRVPGEIMAMNRAVHYYVWEALHPTEKKLWLREKLAEVWNSKALTIKDDLRVNTPGAKKAYKNLLGGYTARFRGDALKRFDQDMTHRAEHMREPVRKSRGPKE